MFQLGNTASPLRIDPNRTARSSESRPEANRPHIGTSVSGWDDGRGVSGRVVGGGAGEQAGDLGQVSPGPTSPGRPEAGSSSRGAQPRTGRPGEKVAGRIADGSGPGATRLGTLGPSVRKLSPAANGDDLQRDRRPGGRSGSFWGVPRTWVPACVHRDGGSSPPSGREGAGWSWRVWWTRTS